jgi:hypothetical protein
MELPLYMLDISDDPNDDAEVQFVALVDRPAIQKNWNAFKNEQKFQIVSEDKRIISGCAMLADTPIFRSDASFGDYYVAFSKDTIVKIVQKYFKKGYQNNVNLMHDPNQVESGVTMFESFISDKSRGISPMVGFEDAPDGSWFVSMLVENDEVWQQVKEGKINGFSIEGIFNYNVKNKNKMASIEKETNLGGPGSGRTLEGGGDKNEVNSPTLDKIVGSKNLSPEKKSEMIRDAKIAIRSINTNPSNLSNTITEYSKIHGLTRNETTNVLADVESNMQKSGEKVKNREDVMLEAIKSIIKSLK